MLDHPTAIVDMLRRQKRDCALYELFEFFQIHPRKNIFVLSWGCPDIGECKPSAPHERSYHPSPPRGIYYWISEGFERGRAGQNLC
jgi:hypothetical protein